MKFSMLNANCQSDHSSLKRKKLGDLRKILIFLLKSVFIFISQKIKKNLVVYFVLKIFIIILEYMY